jgi:hypothetical protein
MKGIADACRGDYLLVKKVITNLNANDNFALAV